MVAPFVAGRYELLDQVADGARGVVYHAVDRESGKTVAIKLVAEELARDPRFVTHFHRQIHAAAELIHPNVVRVFDYGRADGTYFLAEEWVEGMTLETYLNNRGPLPLAEALAIAAAIAAAMAAAHRAGLVHGGITPQDVLIRADGVIKVGDLGIAKPPGMPARPETSANRSIAYYISPEQAQGEAPTPASDVYALGTLLFRMLADRPPFEGATPLAVALKHVNEDVPELHDLWPTVPPAVSALVTRALSKQPSARFGNGAELEQAIEHLPGYRPGMVLAPLVPAPGPSFFQRLRTLLFSGLATVFGLLLVLTIGAALLALAGTALRQLPAPTQTPAITHVAVPTFVGMPIGDAQQLAQQRQLRLDVGQHHDPNVPTGNVIEQSPLPGTELLPGALVHVEVSRGLAPVNVPILIGLDLGAARNTLEGAKLHVGNTGETPSAPENKGQVLAQNPPPGANVPVGSGVDLTLGSGPPPPTAPVATPTAPTVVPPTETATPSPSPATPSPTPTQPTLPPTAAPATPSPTAAPPTATPTTAPPTATPAPATPTPTTPPADSPTPTPPPPEPSPSPTAPAGPAGP